MAYTPYGWQNPYYAPPMPDNLMQMRQPQMQPMAPQMPQVPQAPQNPVAQSGVQWVSGEQEARNWMIAPNAAVALWDSTAPTVYLKQADASGKPSLKIYDLVERPEMTPGAPQIKTGEYVTRKEFDALVALVGEIRGKEKPAKKVKEADADG
jgi:hypothetical protein